MKAQVFTADAITSVGVMLLIVAVALFMINSITARNAELVVYSQIEQKAEYAADYLEMKAQSFPKEYFTQFFSKSVDEIRQELGLPYNFSIRVTDLNGRVYSSNGVVFSKGNYSLKSDYVVTAKRMILLDGEKVIEVKTYS